MGACQFGGFDDFFFGCAGFAVCNIFVDTAGEEVNVLLDYAYVVLRLWSVTFLMFWSSRRISPSVGS